MRDDLNCEPRIILRLRSIRPLDYHVALRRPFMSPFSWSPQYIDTVIVGSGPSALLLSFLLHGNIPHYLTSAPHPDAILHAKLSDDLFNADPRNLDAHFQASRIPYSTAALPINVLFDTVLRPLADTEPGTYRSCIEWRKEPEKVVPHVIIGDEPPGGLWANTTASVSSDLGALSYADQLSLPGYSLQDHFKATGRSDLSDLSRPSRRDVAEYLAAYPTAVAISDSILPASKASGVRRTGQGFIIESHHIQCRHLVLASGAFSRLIQPPSPLQPLLQLDSSKTDDDLPLLVVGSGFSAADVILTHLPKRRIIHVFKWNPEARPSPLRSCHKDAYPEYASVYRLMKKAAMSTLGEAAAFTPLARARSNPFFEREGNYEGLPNATAEYASERQGVGHVFITQHDGTRVTREVGGLQYVVGRRGPLDYLCLDLQAEILGQQSASAAAVPINTLRRRVSENPEVAPNVFVVGSLTGDSLIRFAYGTCVGVAGTIEARVATSSSEKAAGLNEGQDSAGSTSWHRRSPKKHEFQELKGDSSHMFHRTMSFTGSKCIIQ